MKLRAIIFDIYKTLLEVGPPPPDADERWNNLWTTTFGSATRLTLQEFDIACKGVIAREHASAKASGISYPEIFWPSVTREALPEMSALSEEARGNFLYQHAQLQRTVVLMSDAAEVLTRLARTDLLLGIASNSQPYTLRELEASLATANLSTNIFRADLSFYSFDCGFSKPDPHVFRLLTARLASHGISPEEAMMIGDRLDNDIAPARAAGWQTWHLQKDAGENAGDWKHFIAWMSSSNFS